VQHLIVATRNAHKTREIQEILGREFEVRDLSTHPEVPETPESGKTFEENAILKAIAVSKKLPDLVIADDSGLEVDALGGAPGIFSARYAGDNANDKQNIDKLLRELAQTGRKPGQRSARFRCVLALAREGHVLETFAGNIEGKIVDLPRGERGFGYDSIFLPDGFGKTFAELPVETKNRISHRAKAIAGLGEALRRPRI
jgi:XTP/dITP diphosphohydrolase